MARTRRSLHLVGRWTHLRSRADEFASLPFAVAALETAPHGAAVCGKARPAAGNRFAAAVGFAARCILGQSAEFIDNLCG